MTPLQSNVPISKLEAADCAKPVYRWTEDSRIVLACDDHAAAPSN